MSLPVDKRHAAYLKLKKENSGKNRPTYWAD